MQIYLARNNQQAGPYTVEQLNQMLSSQQVVLTDLIWHEGMAEWKTIGEVSQGQLSYYPDGYQQNTHINNNPFQNSHTATAPIETSSRSQDNARHHENTKTQHGLAPISKRFFAKVIDIFIWLPSMLFITAFMSEEQYAAMTAIQAKGIVPSPESQAEMFSIIPQTGWIAMGIYILVMLLIQAFLIHKSGQSLGKKVLKIQIVDAQTKEIVNGYRSFGLRSLVFIIIYFCTFFPLAALIDLIFANGKKRQALHDRLAKTIVIEKD